MRRRKGPGMGGENALPPEIVGQAEGDPRAAGDELQAGRGGADGAEIVVGDRVDDDQAPAGRRFAVERRLDRRRALAHRRVGDQADLALGLQPQPAADIRIGHRVERMLFEARLVEEAVADEEVPHEQRPPGRRKDRTDHGDRRA